MSLSDLQTDYVGTKGRLFRLATWTSLLTVLTLGIYRFWMKTRLRRYYWSAIRPGGHPLEYVGQPLEKLLGFLIAVAFLAFYIGIVNLVLMFLSLSFFNTNFWAYGLSLVGILPILFYARYRARRYILARTRWRGVRFGMQTGAWGYSWRALLHWAITILTAGLLWPRMTFALEKYRTDRTFFGSERFEQGGRWQMLYRPFLPFLTGLIVIAIGAVVFFQNGSLGSAIGVFGCIQAAYGVVHYQVHSFRILTNHKMLGHVRLRSRPRPWRVLRIYIFGYSLVTIALTVFGALISLLAIVVFQFYGLGIGADFELVDFGALPAWLTTLVPILIYFLVFIIWGALRHALVTLPLARHYTQTLTIIGAANLVTIDQRDRDELEQAEGFAEALDVGAAI